ncbi:uncharacterized protein SRS1_13491 [Sporisorium reilianum f. sp. reilianum]|uniref:Effector family protein Eff1 n=1 Tax=Sporisorium reilianum f. sp. reilianum TaxID=72559 RepID=A0A2N8UMP8_9BASI|nr:uncharacterized protein SRS1_13491 [Sporisorium reilianum f. sp. reilianum]
MRLLLLLVLNLIFVALIRCSGLPVTDLGRLLDQDWSVIERVTAMHAFSSSPHSGTAVIQVDSDDDADDLNAAIRSKPRDSDAGAVLHWASTSEHQIKAVSALPRPEQALVVAPMSSDAFQDIDRSAELRSLQAAIRTWNPNIWMERKIMPLIALDLPSDEYSELYKNYLGPSERDRLIWKLPQGEYLFTKPVMSRQSRPMFDKLFRSSDLVKGEYLTAWKLEKYGEAGIWRLLGVLEMPSHRPTKHITDTLMALIPPPNHQPHLFYKGGAHLDARQIPAALQHRWALQKRSVPASVRSSTK